MPEQIQAAGNCAVAALAALIMHLKRIKALDELAKNSTILPYGVRLAVDVPVCCIAVSHCSPTALFPMLPSRPHQPCPMSTCVSD